jgi:outer membrane receptor protein involved in Fe transport
MNLTKKAKLAAVLVGLCAGGFGTQAVSAESDDRAATLLQEILVTATKRGDASTLDIPASISVADEDLISKRGMVGMDDFLRSLPSTNFLDRGAGRNGIIIRGVTASPQDDIAVGIYIDEAPVTGLGNEFGGNPDLKYVDMQRIEVLRGPQGTLYGDGSIAGTVRVIPNAPDLGDFSAEIAGSSSSTADLGGQNTSMRAVLNLPVVEDKFAIRIVGYDYDNSGYYQNIAGDSEDKAVWADAFGGIVVSGDAGDDQYTGGRITALWQVSEDFDVTLSHMAQDIDQSGIPESMLALGGTRRAPFQKQDGSGEALGIDLDVTNLKMNLDMGSFQLFSSTSVAKSKTLQDRDLGAYFGPMLEADDMPIYLTDSADTKSFTQEFRLNTNLDGPWQFLVGAFYQDYERTRHQIMKFEGTSVLDPFEGALLFESLVEENLKQLAFFGEASFDISDKLTAVAGVRHYDYDKDSPDVNDGVFNGGRSESAVENDDSGQTYKLSLNYRADDSASYYGTFSQGFRLGGPHPLIPSDICDTSGVPDQIDSDELDSFEVGAKFALAQGRATLNVSAFQVDWTGIPVKQILDCGFETTANAGEAQSKGVEVDGQLLLADAWRLDYGMSYIQAELTQDSAALGAQSGDRLPGSPEFQASLGLQADFSMAGRPMFARADIAHTGDYYNNLQQSGLAAGNFTTINLSLGAEINDSVSVDFFARNLTNKEGLTWIETELGDGRANYIRPRTIGIELRARFGQ